ncbi:hypothetical protein Q5752_005046 [Cryptotrichosporon argae]
MVNSLEHQRTFDATATAPATIAADDEHKDVKTADIEQPAELNMEADAAAIDPAEAERNLGVLKIEALYLVFGNGWKLWLLWGSIMLISIVYSLSAMTTYTYLAFATSSFGEHTILGTITVITSIIAGVAQPFVAKCADIFSRPMAIAVSVALYALGYLLVAASKNVTTVAAGEVIYTFGNTGISVLTTILLGDITSLQWRGLVNAVFSLPYVWLAFAAGPISDSIDAYSDNGWRWGYGMFCILVPVCIAPALAVLFWADRKSKKLGALSLASSSYARRAALQGVEVEKRTVVQTVLHYWRVMDGFGLILMGFAFACILSPFTLESGAVGGYKNPSMIALLVVGGVLFIAFVLWEAMFAKHPFMPKRVFNRTFCCCVAIDFLYYFSGYLSDTYFSSWVYIVKDWSETDYNYFLNTETVGLCGFSIIAGIYQRYTHRYKYLQLTGLSIRIIGMALNFLAANGNMSTAVLVMSRVLIGLGGSFSVITSQVASQGSVPHADMAIAISILALWTSVGGSIAEAISASVWNKRVPAKLEEYLGATHNSTELASIFSSIVVAREAEPRDLVIQAYTEAVRPLFLAALLTSFLPLIAGLLTTNFYLGDNHNAIEDKEIKFRPEQEVAPEAIAEKAREAEERAKAGIAQ